VSTHVQPVESARDLGVVVDSQLSLSAHATALCRSYYYHLPQLRPAARSLSTETAKTLVQAFISCRLDYCNSLMYRVADSLIQRVQSVQNTGCSAYHRSETTRTHHASDTQVALASMQSVNECGSNWPISCTRHYIVMPSVLGRWCPTSRWQRTASPSISQLQNMRCPTNTEQFRRQRLFCCQTQNLERSANGTATRRHPLWTIQKHAEIVSL